MHFQAVVIALAGASTAMAAALPGKSTLMDRQVLLCSGLGSTPLCCATDVLGVADLDCAAPPETPTSADNFGEICAAIGQRARCCLLPILEQGLICSAP
ncbi:beta ketoadipyl CoA thiolase, th1 [Exophiala bonariae]|uniref:Beta ketoadipyl CoA thiolase, th1 n=1 Tax=Exophiala bonariae TaxID=1690606 RepID=A0AAV9NUW6_9EURO|nr:beta ketoadipyl CoA thiolase, th1 [Exophiala bonariae]